MSPQQFNQSHFEDNLATINDFFRLEIKSPFLFVISDPDSNKVIAYSSENVITVSKGESCTDLIAKLEGLLSNLKKTSKATNQNSNQVNLF